MINPINIYEEFLIKQAVGLLIMSVKNPQEEADLETWLAPLQDALNEKYPNRIFAAITTPPPAAASAEQPPPMYRD